MTTPPVVCPTCDKPLEYETYLAEASDTLKVIEVKGHVSCNQRQIKKLLDAIENPRPVKEKRSKVMPQEKTSRIVINRRNRQNGSKAQTEWARKIHGRNVGILGREDVDDGLRLWEVKARVMPQWIREAMAQVQKHQGDQLRYVAIRHPGKGGPVEWWIVQRAEQFIDTNGYGLFEPAEPKRRMKK